MSLRLMRILLALVFLLSSEVWAIGLGDIKLDSALNEPLRAEIELLSATPEELENLKVTLASPDTFARYGIDRPFYLQDLQFNVSSGPDGAAIQVRSRSPITEPFLTFLVEATWSSGRLLREYTVLLDPPTYAPPAVQQAPAVEAPRRAAPTDSARIERQPPAPQAEPEPEPRPVYTPPPRPAAQPEPSQPAASEPAASEPAASEPAASEPAASEPAPTEPVPLPSYEESPYSTAAGGDYYVERGDTLWGIASRMRPDSRLTMNQTMLAIFEANPQAFSGNINRLKAGVSLSIPSADDVFQISRSDAFSEVKRQNETWGGPAASTPDTTYADTTTTDDEPAYDETTPDYTTAEPAETEPSLVLVPPDEEPEAVEYDDTLDAAEPPTREQEIEQRIAELEAADVPNQQSLIEIRDNELAALRQELAEIRGESYEAPVEDTADEVAAEDGLMAETDAEEAVEEDAAAAEAQTPPPIVKTRRVSEPSIMDRVTAILGSFWTKIVAALVLVAGVLLWFVRRGRGDEAESPWETLDRDETVVSDMTGTAAMSAPTPEEAIVVVEQDSGIRPLDDATVEVPAPEFGSFGMSTGDTGQFGSLEDTFSSDSAVNLDQADPLAEADFHMAYGLYDQAAELINFALENDPGDQALMAKLCEIYFVWGNRDAFVEAATAFKGAVGEGESAEWDKIVIMGQQIAADHELFAGAEVAGATKVIDLSFESEMDEASELDIDLGGDEDNDFDIVDLGAEDPDASGVDFIFDDEGPAEEAIDATVEISPPTESATESPTIEQQLAGMDGTSELPSLDDSLGDETGDSDQEAEATAEINLDELDFDIEGREAEEMAEPDDGDEIGTSEILEDLADITGKNLAIDPNKTGVHSALDKDSSDMGDIIDFEADDLSSTGMRLAPDETGQRPLMDSEAETDTAIDPSLLDATGYTQVLSEDSAVETTTDADTQLSDDDATVLASDYGDDEVTEVSGDDQTLLAPPDDDDEFEFAKKEALPADVFAGDDSLDETGQMPIAGTEVDLDLDDLTAALQASEIGDTVEQLRDAETVEQPRPSVDENTAAVPTMSLDLEAMSEDLHEARTMTEVGTKLDLARAYVDMGDPAGARSILEEVLDEGDEGQRQQAQQLLDSLPS
jgi:pilus assembly protein FimV